MVTKSDCEASPAAGLVGGLIDRVLRWRNIGPFRGGRVVAVAGHPREPSIFYFGACAGGVWRTTDGGTYWENISDGFFGTAAVGAIAVADSDPNVIYTGTGEASIRIDVSHGDGVYKSTDGGHTWRNMGLTDTRHIGRVRIHPENPDLVYVAALGHAFGPSEQRGVFRSKDGGETWEHVLFKSERAGAVDISIDPTNPRVIYATTWETERDFWDIRSGGPGSGIHRSDDGGDTWTELTDNPGLPEGIKGKIGVAASAARPGRVWALVEAKDGGVFRSDDSGATWQCTNDSVDVRGRPWYYSHIFAHPQDEDTVWVLAFQALKSDDGGRTFEEVSTPHGDNHDLWIDPRDPRRMIEGNDGGACVSVDGGATWSTIYNQPTAEFYRIAVDNQLPYRVSGTQQDNSAISVPSRSYRGGIHWIDCYPVGSSESGHIAVKPDDPNVTYSGAIGSAPGGGGILLRHDNSTGQVRIVTVWPESYRGWGAKDMKYRFSWTFPIAFSPHDPGVLYAAGNIVFRSTDEGASWEPISPDLTRDDITKQEISGRPITPDSGAAEVYCTVYALAESHHEPGVLWAGSDDGLVHITRDGGGSWEEITPPGVEPFTMIHMIEASPHDPATAYLASTRYKHDDNRPMLYKTNDYGETWQSITDGIPDDDFTRVVREDPDRRGLLYAGTETGVYVSLDDGESWQSFRGNLPVVPVYDLMVKEGDLVAGTHGRSFWIMDDLSPLRQLADRIADARAYLFRPRDTYRFLGQAGHEPGYPPGKSYSLSMLGIGAVSYDRQLADGSSRRVWLDAGENPVEGVVFGYFLGEAPDGEVTLTVTDSSGRHASHQTSGRDDLPAEQGMNRFVWDMRYPDADQLPGGDTDTKSRARRTAPMAPPGVYRVTLSVGGSRYEQSFSLLKDPRSAASQEDLQEQFDLLVKIRDKLNETRSAVMRARSLDDQLEEWERRAEDETEIADTAKAIREKVAAIRDELAQDNRHGKVRRMERARLNEKLTELPSVVGSTDARPTKGACDVFEDLSARLQTQLDNLQEVVDTDIRQFMEMLREAEIPLVSS